MNSELIKKLLDIIKEKEKGYDFSDYISNFIDIEKLETVEDSESLRDYLNEINEDCKITDAEVIYYASAMNYLKENDPSLTNSIELAYDMGFELKNLNSEILASILKSDNNRDDYQDFINEVIEAYEN